MGMKEDALKEKIIERILRDGPITFRDFMEMALYEPGMGYYTRPRTDIGRAGDFYTAPHLHAAFGWMLAKQLEEMWLLLGKGPLKIIEQGPGRGYLAMDILDRLRDRKSQKGLYEAISYCLVELNPELKKSQEELLRGHEGKVLWAEPLASKTKITPEAKGVLLANELLDAFPVHLVEVRNGAVREIRVGFENGVFKEVLAGPSTQEIEKYLERFVPDEEGSDKAEPGRRLPEGYRTEVNLEVRRWLGEASARFEQGFILVVDYGYPSWDYYGAARNRGTLLGYCRHRVVEDPYLDPGGMDLTAHVNFSALKVFGEAEGFRCAGFCPQGTYLVSLGIEEILEKLDRDGILKLKGLLLPGAMGETHKVMALYKGPGAMPELKGFEMRNQCAAL